MAYDFPNSPTNGQQFTPAGGQTYTWDAAGTKWTVTGTGLSGLPTASTTEVLTGTSTSVAVTPDALAALWEKGTDVTPSGGVVTLGEGGLFYVNAGTITDIVFATPRNGRGAWLIFTGTCSIISNSTKILLPGNANWTAVLSDRAHVIQDISTPRVYLNPITEYSYTYTPTLFSTTNITGTTAYASGYTRIGNTVLVSGVADINTTTGSGTITVLGISLPIASNLTGSAQCTGVGHAAQPNDGGSITGDAGFDRALLTFLAASTGNHSFAYIFSYVVV